MIENIYCCNPKRFIIPEKLDLVIKINYIKEYLSKSNNNKWKQLYKELILKRTGGVQNNKNNLKDYFNDFDNLIKSFEEKGFDDNYPIPVSNLGDKNIILDGSHRLACSFVFNTNIYYYYKNQKGKPWDYKWFLENNFSKNTLEDIIYKSSNIKKQNMVFYILWPTSYKFWDEIYTDLSNELDIIFNQNIKLNDFYLKEILFDVYSYEFGPALPPKIWDKYNELISRTKLRDIKILIGYNSNSNEIDDLRNLKNNVRKKYDNEIPFDLFITLHSSDDISHFNYLLNYFLNKNNFSHIKKRSKSPRQKFINMLREFNEFIDYNNIDKKDISIVGGAVLEAFGIKKCDDIDFIIDLNKREDYFRDESLKIEQTIDIAHKNYDLYKNKNGKNDDEIIHNKDNHFYYRGIKFTNFNIIKKRKSRQKRKKDIADLERINKFENNNIETYNISKNNYTFENKEINKYKYNLTKISNIIERFNINIKDKKINEFIKYIESSNKIYIISDNHNFYLGKRLETLLINSNLETQYIKSKTEKGLNKEDLVIVIINEDDDEVINYCKKLNKKGTKLVSFVSKKSLKINKFADLIFDIYIPEEHGDDSYFFHDIIYLVLVGTLSKIF